jgi:hypothetical protein
MAFEPFNIYSHRLDVRGIIGALRNVAQDVRVHGPDDDWRELVVLGPKRALRRRLRLRIGHSSEFYDGPDWESHIFGMQNYVASFSDAPRMTEIFKVVRSFRFLLAFPDYDLNIAGDDARIEWVQAVCRHLDGIIFTPSRLLDAERRVLIAMNGSFDASAELPAVPPTEGQLNAEPGDGPKVVEVNDGPPTAERVARRAILLTAVGNRGLLEEECASEASGRESCQGMLEWLRDARVSDELEAEEWKIFQRPFGRLESQAKINAVWRLEGAGVLLWALGLYELPPYDQLVTPSDLQEVVRIYEANPARDIVANAKLRPDEELQDYWKHATMTHWRFVNFRLRPTAIDFVACSQGCWIGQFDISRFRIQDKDLVVGNRPIAKADPQLVNISHSASVERHLAINWLIGNGGSSIYSKTDTST